MPITKSAKKSLRASERKREMNRRQAIELEKALKQANANNINEVIAKIDKAAKTGLIHPNKAARLKSRLTKKFGPAKKKTVIGKEKTVKKSEKRKRGK